MQPRVSLIIPVYNEQDYLPKLLDSIKNQTKLPNEIILCDNLSTDNTVKIARTYADSLPLKIIQEPQKGIIPTIEKAWRTAQGDIIIKTDADAYFPPSHIQAIISYFSKHSDIAALTGPVLNAEKEHTFFSIIMFTGTVIGNLLIKFFRGYPLLLGPNSAFRRSMLEKIDGYQSNQAGLDDQVISRKIKAAGGKMAYVIPAYAYHSSRRWHNNPKELLYTFLSAFNPKFYSEKK